MEVQSGFRGHRAERGQSANGTQGEKDGRVSLVPHKLSGKACYLGKARNEAAAGLYSCCHLGQKLGLSCDAGQQVTETE